MIPPSLHCLIYHFPNPFPKITWFTGQSLKHQAHFAPNAVFSNPVTWVHRVCQAEFYFVHEQLAACFMLFSCLVNTVAKKTATFSSETSVDFQQTTQRDTPEDRNIHEYRCENLKLSICPLLLA
jgi:hypothetical protein